ncbi:MAG: DUF131 domain-containing protein [Candidatus Bathyarchaeota archaeon]|nr:DUF131 domain-containing protein [Candidatus Bathyarchaeota archaeon]
MVFEIKNNSRNQETENEEGEGDGIGVSSRLFGLLLAGVALVFIGLAILVVAILLLSGTGDIGGIILIGPIPIVFGSGANAGWLILLGIIITVLSILLFLVMNRRGR